MALGLPTALQINPDGALLFHKGGVEEFGHINDAGPYMSLWSEDKSLHDRIWVLVDSNKQLQKPSPVFVDSPFFVVEAASPRPERQEWVRSLRNKCFFMRPWSFSEVLQV